MGLEKCKDKTGSSWEEALKNMLETQYDNVHLILSDRDCVASKQFAKMIYEKYRVRWGYLKNRSKAYLAERRLSYVKTKLTELMQANNSNNWIQYLPTICLDYNSQIIKGTKLRRMDITSTNYLTYVNQLYRQSDASMYFNSFSMGKFSPEMARRVFRYSVGQRVYLSRAANWQQKKSIFSKPSVVGSFGPEIFTVKERSLKHDNRWLLAATYKLSEIGGHFYEAEITAVDK
jgi:hypothetical protein